MHTSIRRDHSTARAHALPHPPAVDALAQCGLLVTWFVVYLVLRGAVEGSHVVATRHASQLLRIESMLGIDLEHPMNNWVARGPHELATAASFVYKRGYWVLVVVALALCWSRSRRHWYVVLRNGLLASTVIGLVIFWRLPVAPPRAMPGFIDLVHGAQNHLAQRPPGGTNVYAAMPSFHAGWSIAAAAIASCTVSSRVGRHLLWVSGAVMTPVVIVTANHYVLDVMVGIAITVLCVVAAHRHHAQHTTHGPPPSAVLAMSRT